MTSPSYNINEDTPFMTTGKAIREWMECMTPATKDREQEEYNSAQAKKLLLDKGWHVRSHQAFTAVMSTYEIEPIRRGREDWWNGEKLRAIPARKS
jgi:hypothetical protein